MYNQILTLQAFLFNNIFNFLLATFLWYFFLCQDRCHGDVPPHLAQSCYVALERDLVQSSTAHGDATQHSGYYDSMWLHDSGPTKGVYSPPTSLLMCMVFSHEYQICCIFFMHSSSWIRTRDPRITRRQLEPLCDRPLVVQQLILNTMPGKLTNLTII